ncbi:MAG: FkbM family methyltransferase [Acidobacteria bacterium]|nr:FkbM family methyltransferase [Acidobacteriota bacterium]
MAPNGQVISFEPAPETRGMLQETLAANPLRNIRVEAKAVGEKSGTMDLFIGSHHHQSSFDPVWAGSGGTATRISVPVTSLDEYWATLETTHFVQFIKMDIEGGGVFALKGAKAIFEKHRPLAIVESHSPDEDRAISNVLMDHAYLGFRVDNRTWVSKPEATHPEPQGVWGTILLVPKEKRGLLPW